MGYNTSFIGNTFYVSKSNGNNTTAQKGNPFKPYADPWAAVADADDGDYIEVLDGIWNVSNISSTPLGATDYLIDVNTDLNLFAKQVQWYFNSYTGIKYYNYTTPLNVFKPLFKPLASNKSYLVDGNGEFYIYDFYGSGNSAFYENIYNNVNVVFNAYKFYSTSEVAPYFYSTGVGSRLSLNLHIANNLSFDGDNRSLFDLNVTIYYGDHVDYTAVPAYGDAEINIEGDIVLHLRTNSLTADYFTLSNYSTGLTTFDIKEGCDVDLQISHGEGFSGYLNYKVKDGSAITLGIDCSASDPTNIFKYNFVGTPASFDIIATNTNTGSKLKSLVFLSGIIFTDSTINISTVAANGVTALSNHFYLNDLFVSTTSEDGAIAADSALTVKSTGFSYDSYGPGLNITIIGSEIDIS